MLTSDRGIGAKGEARNANQEGNSRPYFQGRREMKGLGRKRKNKKAPGRELFKIIYVFVRTGALHESEAGAPRDAQLGK